jgi:hypothetical protein
VKAKLESLMAPDTAERRPVGGPQTQT